MTEQEKIAKVIELCQRYSHPGVNPGAHALANKVLEILTTTPSRDG